jgi:hypothetical protein
LVAPTPKGFDRERSRTAAKHLLSEVEENGKAGDGTKVDFFTGGNRDERNELNTPFRLLSPVRRNFFAGLASWREKINRL